jgi:hypothetical protein
MLLRDGRRAYSMAGSADVRRKKVGESCPILPNRPWALMLVLQSGAGAVRLSSPIYRAQVLSPGDFIAGRSVFVKMQSSNRVRGIARSA